MCETYMDSAKHNESKYSVPSQIGQQIPVKPGNYQVDIIAKYIKY